VKDPLKLARRRIRQLSAALLGGAFLSAVVSVSPAFALIGGHVTTNPGYAVALTYRASFGGSAADREFCTGTLINPRWVLTAAHCLTGTRLSEYQLILGRTKLTAGGGETIRPAKQIINAQYDGEGHDVALVKLMRSATELPAPVADRSLADQWSPGHFLLVSGWGYTCPDETDSCQGNRLKSGYMRVRSDADCNAAVGGLEGATEICTKTSSLALGSGDSGGPAVIDTQAGPRLVAVNSWGEVDNNNRDIVGGWEGYAEVAGTSLATWVSNKIAAN
jgi:secreted trypsin-like serine protease